MTAALASVLFPAIVGATIVSRRPLTELVESADVIVVASLSSARRTPVADGFRLNLAVRRTLKGELGASTVEATLAQDSVHAMGSDSYGLWFLARGSAPGTLVVLAPVMHGDLLRDAFVGLPGGCAPPLAASTEGALDRVAEELRAALKCVAPLSAIAPAVGAAMEMVAPLDAGDPGFAGVPSTVWPGGATRRLAKELDVAVATTIEAAILGGRAATIPMEFVTALHLLADPDAVPALIGIVDTVDRSASDPAGISRALYRGAARGLSNIHTVETLPTLARLLESADPDVKIDAIMGFGGYANGFRASRFGRTERTGPAPFASSQTLRNMPATDIFLADPERYVGFWRRWWTCPPCRLDRGAPSIALASAGSCQGMTCTIVFSAEVSDPDGDNFRVEWKGCEASDVDPLDCAVITGQPGVVGVRAEARDSYGITSEVTAEAAILPAAYTRVFMEGVRLRTPADA